MFVSHKLGEIYYVKLPETQNGSAQRGFRPCIIAQNEYAIKNTDMVWVVPLTSRIKATHLPFHVIVKKDNLNGLQYDSMTLIESMSYVKKSDLSFKIGEIAEEYYPLILNAVWSQFLQQWDLHQSRYYKYQSNIQERMAAIAI